MALLLPENGIPADLNVISENIENATGASESGNDLGPEIIENTITESNEIEHAFVEISEMEMLQVDQIQQAINIEWPKAANLPINEFQFDGLASMTFPCLFPYGYGDPTKKSRQTTVTETDGFKHLMKYATVKFNTDQMYYPFATNPRFKFWAHDRTKRHRALNQSKVYLKNNIGEDFISVIKYDDKMINNNLIKAMTI